MHAGGLQHMWLSWWPTSLHGPGLWWGWGWGRPWGWCCLWVMWPAATDTGVWKGWEDVPLLLLCCQLSVDYRKMSCDLEHVQLCKWRLWDMHTHVPTNSSYHLIPQFYGNWHHTEI